MTRDSDDDIEWRIDHPALSGQDGLDLVLASASTSRRMILLRAGIFCTVDPANTDKTEIKESLKAERATAMQAAETLAELKARHVARRHPGALVIGADQILDCEGVWFDKPRDRAQAKDHLLALAGKRHTLETAVCVLRDGTRLWHHNARAILRMRNFDAAFIDTYLDAVGDSPLGSVGAYRIEGPGIQFFEQIEGDYFTILGLPLLPLLAFLRVHGTVPA